MATLQFQNMYANSTVPCSVFVIPDSTHPNSVKKAVGATIPFSGISDNANRRRPDPDFSDDTQAEQIAAIAGESCGVHCLGSTGVDLVCNFAWSTGDLITSDSSGYGVVATSGQLFGARAQGPGTVGALCPVDVVTGTAP